MTKIKIWTLFFIAFFLKAFPSNQSTDDIVNFENHAHFITGDAAKKTSGKLWIVAYGNRG